MKQGSTDRIPASSLILFSSIIFTVTTFIIFKLFWKIDVPFWLFVAVLGLQFAVLLLGSSKILTRLGAASLSALLAVAACIGAIFLIFPPLKELQIAGAVGGGSALLFILASFVAASRTDPVPSTNLATSASPEPLFMDDSNEDQEAELIKYGETKESDPVDDQDHLRKDSLQGMGHDSERSGEERMGLEDPLDRVYEFDGLSESKMELALGLSEDDLFNDTPGDDDSRTLDEMLETPATTGPTTEPAKPSTGSTETAIPDDWVEDTARAMAYAVQEKEIKTPGSFLDGTKGTGGGHGHADVPVYRMRTRYKVLDATSGEHHGTYYGDEGYSMLDLESLTALLETKVPGGELRIVKLDWSNFDEVEVHINVEDVLPIDLEEVAERITEDSVQTDGREDIMVDQVINDATQPRYVIYDRRTIQPICEYTPEGDRPRLDRLTLYKMFPDYDFRSFEIDSVRWEDGEIRIFIKGEKKKASTAGARGEGKPKQRSLLDDD